MRLLKTTLALGFFLTACAPPIHERSFAPAPSGFGPRLQDTDLSEGLKAASLQTPRLQWQGLVPTEVYFAQTQNLSRLADLSGQSGLKTKAQAWIQKFYSSPKTTSMVAFAETPYTTLAGSQVQDEVQTNIQEVSQDLTSARSLLKNKILALGKSSKLSAASVSQSLAVGEKFTATLLQQISRWGLAPMIVDGVRGELQKQTASLFQDLKQILQKLSQASTLTKGLAVINTLINKYQESVSADLRSSIRQGQQVGLELDSLQTPQQGLTVLIDLWLMLDAPGRLQNFKTANSSLYDFLSAQSDTDLACLRQAGCSHGLFQGIEKKLFVLPKIQSYGLDKLQTQLNTACLQNVQQQLGSFIQNFVTALPQTYAERIDQGLQSKAQALQQIQSNYSGFVKGLVGGWAQKVLPETKGQVPGFEVAQVQVNFSPEAAGTLQGVGDPKNLHAMTAGASMGANSHILQSLAPHDPLNRSLALAQVNKLVAIGGYSDETRKLIPALLSPVDKNKKPLDLMNFTEISASYGIPDEIHLADSFVVSEETPYDHNFSAQAFAEQIEGLSQMLTYTADWKQTGFEQVLGSIQAQDLTQDLQSNSLQRPLFPKDMLFALNVADAAVLLQDITKPSTPVFLITLNNDIVWADHRDEISNDDNAIMAGIVDIANGQKLNTVQVQSEARFLESIADFIKATDGVEKTKSSLLLAKDANQVAPLDSLLSGRQDLKLLVVALANFISNQFMTDQYLVQGTYYLHQLQHANGPEFKVADQIAAIRALVSAWDVTKIDAYLWSAEEIYFAMNKSLYKADVGFYVNSDQSTLSFPETVDALRALLELKPHLPAESQAQLTQVTAPWLTALQQIR